MVRWFRHWMAVPQAAGRRLGRRAGAALRDGREPLARRAGVAARRAQLTRSTCTASGARTASTATAGSTHAPADRPEPPDTFTYDPAKPGADRPVRRLLAHAGRSPRDPAARRRARLHLGAADRGARGDRAGAAGAVGGVGAKDTDFTAALSDVHPDGTARALTDGILRARYRTAGRRRSCSCPTGGTSFASTSGRPATCSCPATASASRCRAATSRATTAIPTPARRSAPSRDSRGPPDGLPRQHRAVLLVLR